MTTVPLTTERHHAVVPRTSPWLWNWFTWYAGSYLRKRFHAVRLLKGCEPHAIDEGPLIVFANHPSWYDPLVGLYCARHFYSERSHFAPIDAAALAKYRFLSRVGFYGIDLHSRRGAASFLRTSEAIAAQPRATIWITPQGRFTDARARPLVFKPGLYHLARRLPGVTLLPLALEYVYWNESKPEALAAFGEPIVSTSDAPADSLEQVLAALQDRLALAAIDRVPSAFTTLIDGTAGVGGVYDLWRRTNALLRGERFSARHEEPAA